MRSCRLLTHGPEDGAPWVRLYLYEIEDRWAAVIAGDGEDPPAPGSLKDLDFIADTAEEAERSAVAYLGEGVA